MQPCRRAARAAACASSSALTGNAYFALKDDSARIDAVIWKGTFSRLKFRPEEGMEVIATGKVTTFPGSSKYQIVIETLEPAGA
ncbi:exodeoxyribonuclease VII large subunit, partial [Rhizobium ruizarguesonis]